MERRIPDPIVVATRNQGKAAEFRDMLSPLGIRVLALTDLGGAAVPEVEEDGETFAANAEKKARAAALALGLPALADDSGLCVDALDGAPGVHSARYAGTPSSDARNNAKLLQQLALRRSAASADGRPASRADGRAPADGPHPDALSAARFVCALVLYEPETGRTTTAEGACEGVIVAAARGAGGFGYDPLFYIPALGRTFAELDAADKHRISHRGQALRAMVGKLQRLGGGLSAP